MAGITQKSRIAALPLWSLQKKTEWLIKIKRTQHGGYYRYFYCLFEIKQGRT